MATKNKRVSTPQAMTINGVDAGGVMTANIQAGYDNTNESAPDGLTVPVRDREIQFVRGSVVSQDWVHALELFTGTVGTLVFYERKSATAAETGYIKHTITNPVIHRMNLNFSRRGYAAVTYEFECRAEDETKGIAEMWVPTDEQPAPDYISAARGGVRIISAAHGSGGDLLDILHMTDFSFSIAMPLALECNDSDVGYTCVDARVDGMSCTGSIACQDASIEELTATLMIQKLIVASKADLVVTVRQSQGAANKVITVANVDFSNVGSNSGNSQGGTDFTGYSADYAVSNTAGAPLTLEGTNPIISIADAA